MIARWELRYDRVPGASQVISDLVREWFEQNLVECVVGVQSLRNSKEWNIDHINAALSEESLTAAVMQRYHVDVAIRRGLGTKLGSLKQDVA